MGHDDYLPFKAALLERAGGLSRRRTDHGALRSAGDCTDQGGFVDDRREAIAPRFLKGECPTALNASPCPKYRGAAQV